MLISLTSPDHRFHTINGDFSTLRMGNPPQKSINIWGKSSRLAKPTTFQPVFVVVTFDGKIALVKTSRMITGKT